MRFETQVTLGVALIVSALSIGAYFALGPAGVALVIVVAVLARGARLWHRIPALDLPEDAGSATRGFWIALLIPLGLGLVFIGEQVIGAASDDIWWWRTLGGVTLFAALGWRIRELVGATGKKRKVETVMISAITGIIVSLLVYSLSTDAGIEMMGLEGTAAERTQGTFSALWPAILICSWASLFFMELAYRGMPIEDSIEVRRVYGAGAHGLGLALSLVFVVSINYISTARDQRTDLSYLRTTVPSETTIGRVEALDEPVHLYLVYPRVNDVLERLRPYFDQIDGLSDQLTLEVVDHALAVELVTQHAVPRNGYVLLVRGEGEGASAQKFEVGTELTAARRHLRSLDGTFQQHFAQLTIVPRALHMTAGHREHSGAGAEGDRPDQRIGELTALLSQNNIESPSLGIAQGLANEVPEGTRAIAVVGPRDPFLPEEADSLLRYVRGGGRVFMFVDPDVDHGLDPFLSGIGLRLEQGVLHNEASHVRRGTPPSDRKVIFSNHFTAHATVTLVNRARAQGVVCVLDGAGALSQIETVPEGVALTFPMRTGTGFWLDQNGNHEQDEGEPTAPRYHLMAAATVDNEDGEEGRVVVVSDGDFITDAWVGRRAPREVGNIGILLDSVNWLVGEEHVLGPTESEEDIPLHHTTEGDKAIFFVTSFGAPLPFLFMGFWLVARRRRLRTTEPERSDDSDELSEKLADAPLPAFDGKAKKEEEE